MYSLYVALEWLQNSYIMVGCLWVQLLETTRAIWEQLHSCNRDKCIAHKITMWLVHKQEIFSKFIRVLCLIPIYTADFYSTQAISNRVSKHATRDLSSPLIRSTSSLKTPSCTCTCIFWQQTKVSVMIC